MKKLNNLKWFSLGIAVCLLVMVLIVPAFASTLSKTVQLVYNDIKITLNGNAVTPTDATGNAVEPFIMDGTTYLPLRAISNALGLGVTWDATTKTAALTSAPQIISVPDAIFTTAYDKNGYDGTVMYAKAVLQSKDTIDDVDVIYIRTSAGLVELENRLGEPSFDNLVVGNTYTFVFVYYDNYTSPIIPIGIYTSAK
ncbi:MAG: stalk domain-containing protein [Oscillospiraceae bacterium]